MKWLTISQIKRRSKTAKGALKVSYEHWCQLYDATAKELRAEYEKTNSNVTDADYCGLCNYKDYKRITIDFCCSDCVFDEHCPGGLYDSASEEGDMWYRKHRDGDWYSWKRACKAVRDKLGELLEPKPS